MLQRALQRRILTAIRLGPKLRARGEFGQDKDQEREPVQSRTTPTSQLCRHGAQAAAWSPGVSGLWSRERRECRHSWVAKAGAAGAPNALLAFRPERE